MGWEEDLLSSIAPTEGQPKGDKRRKKKTSFSSDEEEDDEDYNQNSDLEQIDSDLEDDEFAQIRSWNKSDLMGDKDDRKRLMSLSELEREMELAERRKKVDAMEERITLKRRLSSQSRRNKGNAVNERLTEKQKKGKSLENLKRKRENKANSKLNGSHETDSKSKRYRNEDSEVSDYYGHDDEPPAEKKPISYEEAISVQVTRDSMERWLFKPDFETTIRGCFGRISLGTSGSSREPVYRCVYISETSEYHRKYKLNNTFTKVAVSVSHGAAKKLYLMDMFSNQPITTKEWERYVMACKTENVSTPSANHVKRKVGELTKLKEHEEFNLMLERKKELKQGIVNIAMERIRLETNLEAARNEGNFDKVADVKLMLADLEEIALAQKKAAAPNTDIAKLNARSRESNLNEIQEAEKAALVLKRKQGVSESDPFARRKTNPIHVINAKAAVTQAINDVEVSKSISISASTADNAPQSDDDDLFDNIDVSILEDDLAAA